MSTPEQAQLTPREQAFRRAVRAAEYLAEQLPSDATLDQAPVSALVRLAVLLESARRLYDSLSRRMTAEGGDPRLADTDVAEIDDAFAALVEQLHRREPVTRPPDASDPSDAGRTKDR